MPDEILRVFTFPDCEIHLHHEYVATVFSDGAISVFAPPKIEIDYHGVVVPAIKSEFADAAQEMGYVDLMAYCLEHELAHRFAVRGIWQHLEAKCGSRMDESICSWRGVQWCDAHRCTQGTRETNNWPFAAQDEEHLANSLQKYVNTGEKDSFNCLDMIFGDRLPEVARRFVAMARPWLEIGVAA